jgi:hypothetical protein
MVVDSLSLKVDSITSITCAPSENVDFITIIGGTDTIITIGDIITVTLDTPDTDIGDIPVVALDIPVIPAVVLDIPEHIIHTKNEL